MTSQRRIWSISILVAVAFGASLVPSSLWADDSTSTVFHPRIVNGLLTSSYPSTGILLMYDDSKATSLSGLCSGTLIGCSTFVTAGHCVCPDNTSDASSCRRFGITDPSTLRVFLQNGGLVSVSSVDLDPDYDFAVSGDVAIVTLSAPVTGIAPMPINQVKRVDAGTAGTIVGFGTSSAAHRATDDAGIKREGNVTMAECPSDLPSDTQVCWNFSGSASNTCSGDSGGPLFADLGSGPVLVGITSGGDSDDCMAPDVGFDSDVFVNRDWIVSTAGSDLGTDSCDLPAVGSGLAGTFNTNGDLSSATPQSVFQFEVPVGTNLLRVGLDAQLGSASGTFDGTNDFDLYVRAGSAPTLETYDCADTNPAPFGFCEIKSPAAGTWYVLANRAQGDGTFQIVATTFSAAVVPSCVGDCNGDGTVSVDEVLDGVRILLGGADLSICPQLDSNHDGQVTVDEILAAVSAVLNGCPVS